MTDCLHCSFPENDCDCEHGNLMRAYDYFRELNLFDSRDVISKLFLKVSRVDLLDNTLLDSYKKISEVNDALTDLSRRMEAFALILEAASGSNDPAKFIESCTTAKSVSDKLAEQASIIESIIKSIPRCLI